MTPNRGPEGYVLVVSRNTYWDILLRKHPLLAPGYGVSARFYECTDKVNAAFTGGAKFVGFDTDGEPVFWHLSWVSAGAGRGVPPLTKIKALHCVIMPFAHEDICSLANYGYTADNGTALIITSLKGVV